MKITKCERQQINTNHPMYSVINDYSIRSNNMYNYANYVIRQDFIKNNNWPRYQQLQKDLKDSDPYKQLMSQASQCVLQVLDRNWKSYFAAMKDWKCNPSKYLGMPKIPKYHKKGARFTWFLKNNQTYIKNGRLYFKLKCMGGYSFKTKVEGRLIAVRFVPKNGVFTLEIIYEKEIEEKLEYNNRIASIDLGVNNFVTLTNNIGLRPVIINGKGIKSINQYYNMKRAKIVSDLKKRNGMNWSNKLDKLNLKRYNRVRNFMHNSSSYVIKYCKENDIDNLVVGLNKTWKQECSMNAKANQNFTFIPYESFISQLEYKCLWNGIRLSIVEESYTSGTSFLDNEYPTKENYNKKRRIKRGLFKSNNGSTINSDVNGSMQIMKKVYPNAYCYGLEGNLTPVVINVCKM